jgi:hypothetical protein
VRRGAAGGLGKAEFLLWPGEHGIAQPPDESDCREERDHLTQWLAND